MNANSVVPPYNETAVYDARVTVGTVVTKFNYALELLTELPALRTRLGVTARSVGALVSVPAVSATVQPRVPRIGVSALVRVPVSSTVVAAHIPAVSGGASVQLNPVAYNIEALAPAFVGEAGAVVATPSVDVAISAFAPSVRSGVNAAVPLTDFAVAAPAAIVWREPVVYMASSIGASTSSFALSWPAHRANDVALLVIEASGADTTLTPPSGWAALSGSPVVDVASTAGSKLQVWWRRAASSAEAAVTIPDGGDHQIAAIATFRGCPTSGDPWDVLGTGTKTVASTTATVPSVTTTAFNSRVVMVVGRPNDSSDTAHFGNPVNGSLTSLVKHFEAGSGSGNGGGFVVASGLMSNKDATGTTTLSKAISTTDTYFVIALKGV
jgi:hypothetical protein